MTSPRMFLSILGLAAGALFAMAATGCYDLSDPSGPHRDDFTQDQKASEPEAEDPNAQAEQKETNAASTEAVVEHQTPVPTLSLEDQRAEEARKKLHLAR